MINEANHPIIMSRRLIDQKHCFFTLKYTRDKQRPKLCMLHSWKGNNKLPWHLHPRKGYNKLPWHLHGKTIGETGFFLKQFKKKPSSPMAKETL